MVVNKVTRWRQIPVLILLTISILKLGTAEVRLYSPQTSDGHVIYACARSDPIILTCYATGSRVTWTTTSNLNGRIVFDRSDSPQVIDQGTITGVLLHNDPLSDGSNMRNFSTGLRVHITQSMMATNVSCSSSDGSSSHIIIAMTPATPEPPIFNEPRSLQQMGSNGTFILYYLQWERPSNSADIELDHYQLRYANDTLIQKVHADQQYAVINLQKGVDVTTTVKIAAADKCGQVSNYDLVSITPNITLSTNLDGPQTTPATVDYVTTSTEGQRITPDSYSRSQCSMANQLVIICITFLALNLLIPA